MTPLRIGVNIHPKARGGQDRSAAEKTYLPQFLRQLNPSAIVIMDDLAFAQDMHSNLPNTIVVYRQYSPVEGHMFKVITPEQYFMNQRGISKPGMPLYCLNEPDSKAPLSELSDHIKWVVRVMELYASAGLLLCVDNLGIFHPDLSWFTDGAKWALVKPLFDAFKRYPQMYWGLHPYWGEPGLLADDPSAAYHRKIEAQLKLRGYTMPLVIFTETGRDARNGSKSNGWKSAGLTEEQYAAEIIKARNTLWTEPYIRGAAVYSYGSTTDQWTAFDVEQAKILHTALIGANQTEQQPPPIIIPPEPPPIVISPITKEFALDMAANAEALAAIHSRQAAHWRAVANAFPDTLPSVA